MSDDSYTEELTMYQLIRHFPMSQVNHNSKKYNPRTEQADT